MPQYQYSALESRHDAGEDTIRLMYLLPGEFNDPLTCKLEEVPIKQCHYQALSYVWGSPEDGRTMTVYPFEAAVLGDKSLGVIPITRNLDIALRYLRYKTHLATLWVDAICINQDDDREKLHQIKLMARTFSEASRCLIWLGETDEWSKIFFNFARTAERLATFRQGSWSWSSRMFGSLYNSFVESVKRMFSTILLCYEFATLLI